MGAVCGPPSPVLGTSINRRAARGRAAKLYPNEDKKRHRTMSTITNTAVSPITPEEVVRQLRALRELIPDFTLQSREEIRPLVSAASVDPELIHESINAIAASP